MEIQAALFTFVKIYDIIVSVRQLTSKSEFDEWRNLYETNTINIDRIIALSFRLCRL